MNPGSDACVSGKSKGWRRGWDSNPRDPFGPNGFQDRRSQPLSYPSIGFSPQMLHISAAHFRFTASILACKKGKSSCRTALGLSDIGLAVSRKPKGSVLIVTSSEPCEASGG